MQRGEILLSELSLAKIKAYQQELIANGIDSAGCYVKAQFQSSAISLEQMGIEQFTQLLIQSKLPQIFAESGVNHDQRDWTLTEESILGDISVHLPVHFYNDGGHYSSYKNHPEPIDANLAYVPGALLRSDLGTGQTADLNEVIVAGKIDQDKFNALYERRLLPQLLQINQHAKAQGKLAAVTVPGIGTGQFAGNYTGSIKQAFREALEYALETHQDQLDQIDIVHYDPYSGDEPKTAKIGHIDYRVRPSSTMVTTGQLAYPDGSSKNTHTLTSFVAWDHFSWPGNDFWPGARETDDGVKAASTDTMAAITGMQGQYQPSTGSYMPPKGHANWQALAQANHMNFNGPIFVIDNQGQKVALADHANNQPSLSRENAQQLLNQYQGRLVALQQLINGSTTHLLRSDQQMVPLIITALQAIAEQTAFEPELPTSGMSSIKSLSSDPIEALEDLLGETYLGTHFGEMVEHYCAEDHQLASQLKQLQQHVRSKGQVNAIHSQPVEPKLEKQLADSTIPSMQILAGFISVLGIACVATAVAILTIGIAPLLGSAAAATLASIGMGVKATSAVIGGVGVASLIGGMGLFKSNSDLARLSDVSVDEDLLPSLN